MNELIEKYTELLLKKCVNFNNSKSLLISYELENEWFIEKLVEKAHSMGINDIYLDKRNIYEQHKILSEISLEEIQKHEYFNQSIWDEYALKNAAFIEMESEYPGLMDDIDPEKLSKANFIMRNSKPIYKKRQHAFAIPWCKAVLPSLMWAKKLFPELKEKEAYNKLFTLICEMCMVNTDNPINSWNEFLYEQTINEQKLNDLNITKLHYKNSLGTDLHIELNSNAIWANAGSLGENMLANCPTYEIFTTPDFRKTNGIVYSSRSLYYNGGLIDNFYLEFKDGKVVNYDAEVGKELLKNIIESDEYSSYLGETALVNDNSPISNTGIVYGNTIFDENASCHLALGSGFSECIKNSELLSDEELLNIGINPSKNHVDFMVGTSDLTIEAETNKGKILILKDGNLNL